MNEYRISNQNKQNKMLNVDGTQHAESGGFYKKKKGLESRDIWKSLNDYQTMAEPVFLSLQEWAPALLVTKTAGLKTEPFLNDIDLQK